MDSSNLEITPSSNPLWLQKINLDIIFAIVSWLDPLSTLSLSWVCKTFQEAIGNDILVWRRALRNITAEHCISPHSFLEPSIQDMKRISIRPSRLIEGFRDPKGSLHVSFEQHTLDYGTFLNNGSSDNPDILFDLDYMDPFLLPGGRWILSGIVDNDKSSTHLLCWDCLSPHSDGSPLQPAAFFTWKGSIPKSGKWLKTQFYTPNTVCLACTLWGWDDTSITHYILHLSWGTDSAVPLIQCMARLDHDSRYIERHFFRDGELHGDYMIFDTIESIAIWNWKENTIGGFNSEEHEWADGSGFVFAAMPPYVYIFPHKLREILILEIPKLYPVGTNESYKPILPASVTPHPFLSHDIDGLSWSSVIVLDRWKPPSLRSGIVVLHSRRRPEMGGNLFHVLSLHATDAPSCSREQLDSFLPYNDSEYACASLVNGPGGGMLLLDCLASLKVKEEPLDFRFFPFTNDDTLGEPIKRRHFVAFPYVGKLDPLCLVSGTAILKEECHGVEPNTQLVGIARFDSRSFKDLVVS